jgi:hypothetical protein
VTRRSSIAEPLSVGARWTIPHEASLTMVVRDAGCRISSVDEEAVA